MKKMKVMKKLCNVVLVVSLVLGSIMYTPKATKAADATLLSTYGKTFGYSGTCINSWQLNDWNTLNQIKQQYNSITLENEMKPDSLLGGWGANLISVQEARNLGYYIPANYKESNVPRINFGTIDDVMKKCHENGLKMRAHTLVWHAQTPDWFFKNGYSGWNGYVDQNTMYARMEMYIKSVINHVHKSQYGSVVYAWDVVNEYFHAENTGWLVIYGDVNIYPEFVKRAFTYAHEALVSLGIRDSVGLFYNDFNTYIEVNKIIPMINFVNRNGKVCDGVGMQSHVASHYPSVDLYTQTIESFLNAGFEVQITEFDCTNKSDEELNNYMGALMQRLLEMKAAGGNITGITYWGVGDDRSWRGDGRPLLFSSLGNPKPAYYRVMSVYDEFVKKNPNINNNNNSKPNNNIGNQNTPVADAILNGGFEDGTQEWKTNGNPTLGLAYYTVANGKLALKVSDRKNTGDGPMQDITGCLFAGNTYNISAKIQYKEDVSDPASMHYPANKQFIISIIYGDGTIQNMVSTIANKGQWATFSGTYTVPKKADLSSVKIFIETPWLQNPNASQDLMTFYVDDVSITFNKGPVKEGIANKNDNPTNNNGGDGSYNGGSSKEVYLIKKYTYQIISEENKTVAVTGLTKKKAKKIRIKNAVNINGQIYKVVKVKASAFKKCKKAKKVIIGKNVTSIGKKAFFKCKKIKNISISSTITSIDKTAFGKVSKKAKVKLPNGKVVRLSKYLKKKK